MPIATSARQQVGARASTVLDSAFQFMVTRLGDGSYEVLSQPQVRTCT